MSQPRPLSGLQWQWDSGPPLPACQALLSFIIISSFPWYVPDIMVKWDWALCCKHNPVLPTLALRSGCTFAASCQNPTCFARPGPGGLSKPPKHIVISFSTLAIVLEYFWWQPPWCLILFYPPNSSMGYNHCQKCYRIPQCTVDRMSCL